MSGMSVKRKAQRLRLHKQQAGLCYWCNAAIKIEPDGSSRPKKGYATIDHLHPKGHPERGKHTGELTHVLACRKCNHDRNIEFLKTMPPAAIWAASGRYPSSAGEVQS